ncbi:MAG: hypothetical protein JW883_00340 [Deltaproteobacteria bacterium]|nr:hypothetical protein [Deltaproteobacteria bacterium]
MSEKRPITPLSEEAVSFIESESFDAILRAVDELYINVSWCVWHEGVRIFDDSYPGNMGDIHVIRNECLREQTHNDHAAEMIRRASNNAIKYCLIRTERNVEAEHQLSQNFNWVSWHERRRDDLRAALSRRDFNRIRLIYWAEQEHNPNARHLLSCVSNYWVEQLVNAL